MQRNLLKKLWSWYFCKNVLPYWAILLADTLMVFACAVLAYLSLFGKTMAFQNLESVMLTSLVYALLSWVGARSFKTYSGIQRYTSFEDLMRLAYSNLLTLSLALCFYCLFTYMGWGSVCAHTLRGTFLVFALSTMAMWTCRIVVKSIFEACHPGSRKGGLFAEGGNEFWQIREASVFDLRPSPRRSKLSVSYIISR